MVYPVQGSLLSTVYFSSDVRSCVTASVHSGSLARHLAPSLLVSDGSDPFLPASPKRLVSPVVSQSGYCIHLGEVGSQVQTVNS